MTQKKQIIRYDIGMGESFPWGDTPAKQEKPLTHRSGSYDPVLISAKPKPEPKPEKRKLTFSDYVLWAVVGFLAYCSAYCLMQ